MNRASKILQKISPNIQKILTNASWLMAERVFRMILSLLIGVWVVRYLGPQNFGQYSYALAIVGLLTPLSRMGLPQIVSRDLARNPSQKDKVLGTSFLLEVLGGATVIPLAILLSTALQANDRQMLVFIAIVSTGELLRSFEVIEFWFNSQVKSKYVALTNAFAFSCSNLLKLILLLIHADLLMFVAIYPTEFALISLAFIFFYTKDSGSIGDWRFDARKARQILSDSWPLIFSAFVVSIYLRSDQIMIAQILGDKETGIYAAAVRVSEMWYFIPIALIDSIAPSIFKASQESRETYYEKLKLISNLMVFISYIASIFVTFSSHYIIRTLYGLEYAEAGSILSLHIWGSCFIVLGMIRSLHTTADNVTYIPLISTSLGAIMNVLLNLFLIPKHGAIGAAEATLISQATASYLSSLLFPETRRLFYIQSKALTGIEFPRLIRQFNSI